METNFKFKSQICTSSIQSERLIALGLKKETADCALFLNGNNEYEQLSKFGNWEKYADMLPAWSLDRLRELYKCVGDTSLWNLDDVNYDRLIQCIGLAIKHNSFNKEYLV